VKLTTLATLFVLAAATTARASSFQITLDTSPLTGVQTFGFGLTNFDSATNVVSLSEFDFGGGNAVAASQDCTLGGAFSGAGCGGDLSAGITLEDLDPTAAFFTQQFNAGSSLSFVLETSNSFSGAGIPDQLALYICDATLATCYSDDATGALLLLDLSGGALAPSSFVTFSATLQGLNAPVVTELASPTAVPEPAPAALVGIGAAALAAIRKRRGRVRRLVSLSVLILVLASSPLHASTIVFERGFGDMGGITYSPTREAVTVTNWAIDRLFVSDGILPDPVEYDVDGTVDSDDPGDAGSLEFFIDGCVPAGTIFPILAYKCTPTVASYIQIVGSIPDLGIPQQSLLVADLIGGAPESFSAPIAASRAISGGAPAAMLAVPLSQALGLDPTTPWEFTFVVRDGLQFPPLKHDQVIATNGELAAVPEPSSMALLGTGVLACARRLQRRGR